MLVHEIAQSEVKKEEKNVGARDFTLVAYVGARDFTQKKK